MEWSGNNGVLGDEMDRCRVTIALTIFFRPIVYLILQDAYLDSQWKYNQPQCHHIHAPSPLPDFQMLQRGSHICPSISNSPK